MVFFCLLELINAKFGSLHTTTHFKQSPKQWAPKKVALPPYSLVEALSLQPIYLDLNLGPMSHQLCDPRQEFKLLEASFSSVKWM